MIGPGIPNPMLWGASDPLDGFGKITHSLRLRSSAGAYLSRTVSAAGNRKKWGLRLCIKRGAMGVATGIFGAEQDAGNRFHIAFDASDKLVVYQVVSSSTVQINLVSTRVFRDPSAHYDLNFRCNTDSGGIVIEVNGEAILLTGTQPAAGLQTFVNGAFLHYIGNSPTYSVKTLDAYISFVSFIDGDNPVASAYGQKHPATNQWRPRSRSSVKQIADAAGGNSFFLPFDNIASLSTLPADASVNVNNWATANVSLTAGFAYDSMPDTPTNNFNTFNMLSRPASETVIATDGSLVITNTSTNYATLLSTIGMTSGKWYCEGVITTNTSIINSRTGGGLATAKENLTTSLGTTNQGWGYYSYGGIFHNNSYDKTVPALAENDVFMIAFDADAGNLWFGKNGVWHLGGNPATGANPMYSGLTDGPYFFAAWAYTTSDSTQFNFGQRAFVHSPPTDFLSLCTKNLPTKPAVMRPSDAFVAVTDSGASIVAALSDKAQWSDWIRIYKRRDATEGWRWQFSDDAANFLDSSGTAAKATFPALSGTAYVGYAIKLAAVNGVSSGRLAHVSGVADVVLDGLSKSRKMVILKNEATGNWVVFHPDLTAGKLLYLNSTAAETTDATISAVNSSGFTVAAALASGTYRWIAFSETDGFIRIGKYVGNGSIDGPFSLAGSPALTITHVSQSGVSSWGVVDSVRDTGNPSGSSLALESQAAESVGTNYLDQLSNGFKLRQSAYNSNNSGQSQITLSLSKFPFRYANAR